MTTLIAWNKGKSKEEFPQLANSGVKSGHVPWNKGKTGYFKKGTEKGRCLNTGKTHFKKGYVPWNAGTAKPKVIKVKVEKKVCKSSFVPLSKEILREHKRFRNQRYKASKIKAFGNHTIEEWELLKGLYGNVCVWCETPEPFIKLTEDHIVPLSEGGSDNLENIQPLCVSCNTKKHARELTFLPVGLSLNWDDLNYGMKGSE